MSWPPGAADQLHGEAAVPLRVESDSVSPRSERKMGAGERRGPRGWRYGFTVVHLQAYRPVPSHIIYLRTRKGRNICLRWEKDTFCVQHDPSADLQTFGGFVSSSHFSWINRACHAGTSPSPCFPYFILILLPFAFAGQSFSIKLCHDG